MPFRPLLLLAALGCGGCGTVMNLKAPPPPGPPSIGIPETCFPFGGVARSGMLGLVGPTFGVMSIAEGEVTAGAAFASAGVLACVDIPLSLVGDVLTLPIALARQRREPWALTWGDAEGKSLDRDGFVYWWLGMSGGRAEPPPGD